jgi:hypothetical protein
MISIKKARDLQRPAAALAEAAQSLYVAELSNTKKGRPIKPKPQPRRQLPSDFVIDEVLPSWGECKRYSRTMDHKQYHSIVAIARQIYHIILKSPDPCKFPQKELQGDLLSAVTSRWLVFQNIKDAAINRNFSLIEIGYNRNEAFLAAKAKTDPARKAFVERAVDFIRSNGKIHRKITREALFEAWSARGGQPCAKAFFTATLGTPLSI